MRTSLALLAALLITGCSAAAPERAAAPEPPRGSYLRAPDPLPPEPEPDLVLAAQQRTRVLEIGDVWPTVEGWDGAPPVDRGDGVLRVRATLDPCWPATWATTSCAPPPPCGPTPGWRGAAGWSRPAGWQGRRRAPRGW
ncbi:MAG: hypothetical protein M9894_28755 [Planctomycetes bacterium]|nr:hypothetical protein [Planctomycetota bacterium]